MSTINGEFLGQKTTGGTTNHSALSNLDYASAGHTGFLGLDQTTPQTVTGGIPLLTGLTPTTDYQIATKKYVDDKSYSRREDRVEPYSYCGTAPLGSLESDSVWNIYRIEILDTGGTTIKSALLVKRDDRLTATYT